VPDASGESRCACTDLPQMLLGFVSITEMIYSRTDLLTRSLWNENPRGKGACAYHSGICARTILCLSTRRGVQLNVYRGIQHAQYVLLIIMRCVLAQLSANAVPLITWKHDTSVGGPGRTQRSKDSGRISPSASEIVV
jgi:hypothetical protein